MVWLMRPRSRNFESQYRGAIKAEDYTQARKVIATAIEQTQQSKELLPDDQYQLIVWKSRLECLAAYEERERPEKDRDLNVLAAAYQRAAEVSVPPEGVSSPKKRDEMLRIQHTHRSNALRWQANASLLRTPPDLRNALKHFQDAKHEAELAATYQEPSQHLAYLTYWEGIVAERVAIDDFVASRDVSQLGEAKAAISRALEAADSFRRRSREASIFPNRFYSYKHLELEPLWIEALEKLVSEDFKGASDKLDKYCNIFPEKSRLAWWHSNIRVRCLAAHWLAAMQDAQPDEARTHLNTLVKLVSEEPCGGAAEAILDSVKYFNRIILCGGALARGTTAAIQRYWPIDAQAEQPVAETEGQTWQQAAKSLPSSIEGVLRAETPNLQTFNSAWAQLMALLLDYYDFPSWREKNTHEIKNDLQGLNRNDLTCRVLALPPFAALPQRTRSAIEQLARDPRKHWQQRSCLKDLLARTPLLVARPQTESSEQNHFVAYPYWSRQERRGFRIHLFGPPTSDFSQYSRWFLKPESRKGTLPTMTIGPEGLRPCRLPCQIETLLELAEAERHARDRFEILVRQYLSAPVEEAGYQVELRNMSPETDFFVEMDVCTWVGEIKFSINETLPEHEATRARNQLGERAKFFHAKTLKESVSVIATNASNIPEDTLTWAKKNSRRRVWKIYLNGSANDFLRGPGIIITRVQDALTEHLINKEYLTSTLTSTDRG